MHSVEIIVRYLTYDPSTGILTWKPRVDEDFTGGTYDQSRRRKRWNSRFAGKEAGIRDANGYVCMKIHRQGLKAHHASWVLHFGEWPSGHIDHINGNRSDNRIDNLRCVSQAENNRNAGLRKDNKSGVSGVRLRGKKWDASIRAEGKQVHLGSFTNKDDAVSARKAAMEKYGYHEGHGAKR